MKLLLRCAIVLLLLATTQAHAADDVAPQPPPAANKAMAQPPATDDATFALGLVAGLPQMLGGEFRFLMTKQFQVGAGYGFFPINGFLQNKIALSSYSLGDGISLQPTATYSLTSISGMVRYYPDPASGSDTGGFFLELLYTYLNGTSNVSGNASFGGQTISNIVSGTMSLTENIIGVMAGKEIIWPGNPSWFFEFAGGLAYKTSVSVSTSLNSDTSQLSSIPGVGSQVNNAISSVTQQTESGLQGYNDIPVIPIFVVTAGVRF